MKNILIYGAPWCKDCRGAKEILDQYNIDYTFLDISDPEQGQKYAEKVIEINNGKRVIPTLIINDEIYINPNRIELENILATLKNSDTNTTYCNKGKELFNGDTVLLTRDLDVKGSSLHLKQGTALEKIKLTDNPTYIDCKIGKSIISIKTEFVKKKG